MKLRLMVVSALLLAGCLLDEATHTVYVEADGTTVWSITQTLVREDSDKPGEREKSETDFLSSAYAGHNPVAEGLRKLGAWGVETHVTRTRRPFTVTTEGHFDSLEAVVRAMASTLDVPNRVEVTTEGPVTRLRFEVDPRQPAAEGEKEADEKDDVSALFSGTRYRVALAQGKFIEARGFELSSDGAVATPQEQKQTPGEPLVWELAWTRAP